MGLFVQLIPFALVAVIIALVVKQFVRASITMPRMPRKKTMRPRHLRAVDPKTMDRELNDLLKKR